MLYNCVCTLVGGPVNNALHIEETVLLKRFSFMPCTALLLSTAYLHKASPFVGFYLYIFLVFKAYHLFLLFIFAWQVLEAILWRPLSDVFSWSHAEQPKVYLLLLLSGSMPTLVCKGTERVCIKFSVPLCCVVCATQIYLLAQ